MKKSYMALLLALVMLFAAGCGTGNSDNAAPKEMDLNTVYESFDDTLPEMTVMNENMMLNFCGINAADCRQAVVAVSSDGLLADEVWLIEAVDAEALARLEALAQTRLNTKDEESKTYSPEQNAVVKKAQVITVGNYIAVLVSPDVETLVQLFKTAAGI